MMKLEGALYPWRFRVVIGLLGNRWWVPSAWRIIDLQVVDRDFLKGQGGAQPASYPRFRRTAG